MKKSNYSKFLFVLFVLFFSIPNLLSLASCQSSVVLSDKFAVEDVKNGEYIIQNNIWGANTSQEITIWDTNHCGFNVSQSSHNSTEVSSYPSIFKGSHWGIITDDWVSLPVSDVKDASFHWNTSSDRPEGIYNVAAEAWFSADSDTSSGYSGGAELMIWMDTHGMVPAGTKVGSFRNYDIYYDNWGWNYICYFLTGTNYAALNLIDFIDDSVSRGYINDSWYFHVFEVGFEICSGGEGLMLTDFSMVVTQKDKENKENKIDGFSNLLALSLIGILGLFTIYHQKSQRTEKSRQLYKQF